MRLAVVAGKTCRSFLLLVAGVAGCATVSRPDWTYWPSDPPERVRYETPAKRIGRYDMLGRRLAKARPDEQRQITAELARQIEHETDPVVRVHILHALARSSVPTAAAIVRAGLKDKSPAVRIACCQALADRQDAETLTALAGVLRDDTDMDVRQAATRCLAHFKGPAAISAMTAALEDRDPALQYVAVQSLRQMTQVDYGNDVRAWLEFAHGGHPRPTPPTMVERLRQFSPF